MEHLKINKILVEEQFGFRKNLATEEVIYKTETISLVGGIFCDLEKPFRYVSHEILLSKLTSHVVIGKAKGFFKSYLSDRNQRVQITDTNFHQNTFFKWAKVKHGVPHGLILGPLLLLPYTKDSPKVIESKANLFFF